MLEVLCWPFVRLNPSRRFRDPSVIAAAATGEATHSTHSTARASKPHTRGLRNEKGDCADKFQQQLTAACLLFAF